MGNEKQKKQNKSLKRAFPKKCENYGQQLKFINNDKKQELIIK